MALINMPEIVYVEWLDSASNATWQALDSYTPGLIYCKSIGYLVREDKTSITLAGSLASEHEHGPPELGCGWIDIPKVAIRRRASLTSIGIGESI